MSVPPDIAAPAARPPGRRLAAAGLAPVPALAALAWPLGAAGPAAGLAVYLGGLWLAVRGMGAGYPHDRMGACNLVTTARLALVAAVAALGLDAALAGAPPGWPVFAAALLALALDGVDGALARRARLASEFGARYDMEVDAALAATLAAILLAAGRAGPELLVLGFARYAFVAATRFRPRLAAPLPESLARKAVCVAQIATLTLLTAPALPEAAARPLALAAAAALAWSFGRDLRWLARRP